MIAVLERISFLCLVLRVAGVPGDIAHDKRAIARVLDNIAFPNQRYADLAVDDDPKTCSSTDFANSSRTEPPWWRIWFPYNVIFSNIEMTINKTTLQYIYNVSVSVTNMTETESKHKTIWHTPEHHCYHGDGLKLSKDSEYAIIKFYCISLSIGNTIKITLALNKSQLEICDVNINQACINDTFGPNCSITCNEHCTGLCDSVNGTCSRCELHFKWPCENFTYGQNCSERCDEICLGPCNKTGAALNVLLDVRDHIVTNATPN
ncbi:uncharacterized protein LOC128226085 [Mya arenaria]|uniref:uncharacterized protein LOC128226085 n=1 Tax=Mya arenaria TaxID=6604 RepID=UPI0022E58B22|nr:uncharacterized protein LOC128226085 [Mya arenaria]